MIELEALKETLTETIEITTLATIMMIAVELIQINFKEKISRHITTKKINQIVGSSIIGAIPGCSDAFFVVSLYTHNLVGFGALTAVMLSTAGDEAFVMLQLLPPEVFATTIAATIVVGIVGGFIAEWMTEKLKLKNSVSCVIELHQNEGKNIRHFIREHIIKHILKEHALRLFLWIFFTLIAVEALTHNINIEKMLPENTLILLVIAAAVGIIPESGPHLIFLTLFAKGLIPFSVFLTNTLVQDGHGLLPLLSCSPKEVLKVKAFNVAFGLLVGTIFFMAGV